MTTFKKVFINTIYNGVKDIDRGETFLYQSFYNGTRKYFIIGGFGRFTVLYCPSYNEINLASGVKLKSDITGEIIGEWNQGRYYGFDWVEEIPEILEDIIKEFERIGA